MAVRAIFMKQATHLISSGYYPASIDMQFILGAIVRYAVFY
jgi:hypothetical protein